MDEPKQHEPSHNKSTEEVISSLRHHAEPPIEEILEYYNKSIGEIRAMLIGSEKDPINIAKQFSLCALEQTRKLLSEGRGNVYQDIMTSKGKSHMGFAFVRDTLLCVTRDMRSAVRKEVMPEYRKIIRNTYGNINTDAEDAMVKNLLELQVRTHLALRYQAGNCHEYAYVAMECLFTLKKKLGEDFANIIQNMRVVSSGSPSHHVFVEMDVKNTNGKTEIMICDPWAGYAGMVKDIPDDFYVCGIPPECIYSSNNKNPILSNGLIAFAFKHQTHLDHDISCFGLYYGSINKENNRIYCNYLKSLPDVPTIEYQKEQAYKNYIGTDPVDYKKIGELTCQDLKEKHPWSGSVPMIIDVDQYITGLSYVYSQPNHPKLHYNPEDKSKKYDADIDDQFESPKVSVKETKQSSDIQKSNDKKTDDDASTPHKGLS